MLLSIIVPVYNAAPFLDKCVQSILNQSFEDFELLLINDGSKDNSGVICDGYAQKDKRVKVFHQANAGVSAARNKGLDHAQGEWIAFVDSDDWVENDYFFKIIESISSFSRVEIIVFGYYKTTSCSKIECYSNENFNKTYYHNDILDLLKNTNDYNYLLFPINKIYKRNLLEDNGVRFHSKIKLGEDSIFNLQAFYNSKSIVFIKKPIYNYFENVNSVTSQKYKPHLYESMELHFNEKLKFYENHNNLNLNVYKKDIARVNLEKTFYAFLGNIIANKDLSFVKELGKIRKLDLINFGFENYQIHKVKDYKKKITLALFKYYQFWILKLIYKRK